MGQDFFRAVEGYNLPTVWRAYGTLYRNNTVTLNVADGPGRIKRVEIIISDTDAENPCRNMTKLVIDGITIFEGWLSDFTGVYGIASYTGIWEARQTGATHTNFEMGVKLDFMHYITFSITNTASPSPTSFSIFFWGERGH